MVSCTRPYPAQFVCVFATNVHETIVNKERKNGKQTEKHKRTKIEKQYKKREKQKQNHNFPLLL